MGIQHLEKTVYCDVTASISVAAAEGVAVAVLARATATSSGFTAAAAAAAGGAAAAAAAAAAAGGEHSFTMYSIMLALYFSRSVFVHTDSSSSQAVTDLGSLSAAQMKHSGTGHKRRKVSLYKNILNPFSEFHSLPAGAALARSRSVSTKLLSIMGSNAAVNLSSASAKLMKSITGFAASAKIWREREGSVISLQRLSKGCLA
jgi:hypothetical protein